MIDSVRAENFGMHRKIEWKHLHNINMLLGINGTSLGIYINSSRYFGDKE